MANYSNLKAAIAAAIKTNGNQEITGQVLQDVLNSIVSVIGANYTFAGVATPATNPGTPDQNVVYMASQAGTYTNFNGTVLPAGIHLLMWNGTWTSNTVMCGDGGVFDISVYKASGGTLAKFVDLAAALDGGNNIPQSFRKGGMSVKFVQSSDNKYVQFRLMSDSFNTTVANWQGVDDEPTIGSGNLVKSDGVKKHSTDILQFVEDSYFTKGSIPTTTNPVDLTPIYSSSIYCLVLDCTEGDTYRLTGTGVSTARLWAFIDSSYNVITMAVKNAVADDIFIVAPANSVKLILNINFKNEHSFYKCRQLYPLLFLDSEMYFTNEQRNKFLQNALSAASMPTKNGQSVVIGSGIYKDIHNRQYYKNHYFTTGGYYNIVGNVGDTITPTVVSQDNMLRCAIPCNEGDVFLVTVRGISITACIAIIDNNNVLQYIVTSTSQRVNFKVTAPVSGTVYVNGSRLYTNRLVSVHESVDFDILTIQSYMEGVIGSVDTLTNCANCKVLITEKINLNGASLSLNNVGLVACGGLITNGTLNGTYSIEADDYQQIFSNDVVLGGVCKNRYLSICWFGAVNEPYDIDSHYNQNYGKHDSTLAIQSAINNSVKCGVNSVYVPQEEGAYFVRCQVQRASQEYQGDSDIYGQNAALYIPDNIEIFGDGTKSKLVVLDYQSVGEKNSETYRTQQLMTLSDYSDEELNTPLIDTSTYQTALEAVNAVSDPYMHKKYGRHDIDIHHLWLSTRKYSSEFNVSSRCHAIAINLCSNILAGAEIETQSGRNIQVHDCYFYDVVQAVHTNNDAYSLTEEGQAVIQGVSVYNNKIRKVYNKAIEFNVGSRNNNASFNEITESSCGIQCIFDARGCSIESNLIYNCTDGINIAQSGTRHRVLNNNVSLCKYPFRFRSDAANWDGELVIDNIVVDGNLFLANAGNTPLCFTGHKSQDDSHTGVLHIKNVYFTNNVFEGNKSYIGCTDTLNLEGYQSWLIEDIVCDKNVWNSNVQIINSVVTSGSRPSSVVQNIIFKDMVQSGKTLKIDNASAYLLDVLNHGTIDASAGTILVNRVLNQ